MASLRQWWRRAAAALKDRRSLLLARLRPRWTGSWNHRELEAAVIRATSHEDRWMDYRSTARVFAWARTSPTSLRPVMWALARRARRTRCWVVALKSLMIAHGLLLRSGLAPPAARAGRVPFELADFRDRSSSSSAARSLAFSGFVRAYIRFLDYRSLFAAQEDTDGDGAKCSDPQTACLDRIEKKQFLLELLLQIRPYGDGMGVPLVLEAMDCALIEIFQVYAELCTGITRFLVSGVPGPAKPPMRKAAAATGVKVLWRAAEQSAQLSSYFELCSGLGVANARKVPAAFVRLKDDDVRHLERILVDDTQDGASDEVEVEGIAPVDVKDVVSTSTKTTGVMTTTEWVAFDEEKSTAGIVTNGEGRVSNHWNPFVVVAPLDVREGGNLIELF